MQNVWVRTSALLFSSVSETEDDCKIQKPVCVRVSQESRDLFAFDGHTRKRSMSSSMGPGIIQEELRYMRGEEDAVDGKKVTAATHWEFKSR